ncbi:hypothetical protein OHA88_06085 [Streptomyces sp. NBC_00353]|uniref:hypothetical protein n=1 Tax=Streptomyces sp. NBC_00353 TaxID=2975722 RepID=UPI002E253D0A
MIAYLGLIVSAIGLGIATQYTTAISAMLWFTAAVLAVLAAARAVPKSWRVVKVLVTAW